MSLSLNSCSKSDSGSGGSISFKVDGTTKSYSNVAAVTFGGQTTVFGYNGSASAPTSSVSINMTANETGANAITSVSYDNGNLSYYNDDTLVSNATTNSATSAKGTFSGSLFEFDSGAELVITEGKFSAKVTDQAGN